MKPGWSSFDWEQEAARAELETARLQGEGLREELKEAEDCHAREVAQLTQQIRELEMGVESQRSLQRSAVEDLQRVRAELEGAREDWERERGSLATLVKVRTHLVFLKCLLSLSLSLSLSQEKEVEIAALQLKVLS